MMKKRISTTFLAMLILYTVSPAFAADEGWISLFNGKNMDGWRKISPHPNKWVVENGLLINKGKGCDIAGGPDLGNYQLHVEFKIPKGSNAGVYLRGHYEIQVHDCYGDDGPTKTSCCGAIYGQHAPRINASRPPGEWQTFDATIIKDRVWVVHNGVHILTNVKLTGKTGAAMPGKHGDPGPLKIQGDHGPITLRNILVRPIAPGEHPVPFPPKTGFTRITNGKNIDGWKVTACGHGTGGKWEDIDGAIAGDQDKPGNGGILLSEKAYGDFEVTADVKPDWGVCSGFFLRSNTKGQCYQVMVDYHTAGNVGGLYGEGIGGFNLRNYDFDKKEMKIVPRPSAEKGTLPFPKGMENSLYFFDDWNHLRARVVGNPPTIDVWLNGVHMAHFTDTEKRLPDTGHIGLQVHGGKSWPKGKKTRFKQIEIKELK